MRDFDPMMLLGIVNTRLRDGDGAPEDVLEGLDLSWEEVQAVLQKLGYRYDEALQQFRIAP